MNQFWRLSDAGADNLGLACTDDGLLLGPASLIERRGGCYIVRERDEIDRLLKRAYEGEPPVDRLMGGLATIARALNAETSWRVEFGSLKAMRSQLRKNEGFRTGDANTRAAIAQRRRVAPAAGG
jgi:hypothetical protein